MTWPVAILLLALLLITTLAPRETVPGLADLQIYQESIRGAAAGGSVYDYVFHHPEIRPEGYGFTYPPSAAIVLWPLAWISSGFAQVAWTVAGLLVVVGLSLQIARSETPPTGSRAAVSALGTIALACSFPVISHLVLGQVSLFMTALVLADAVIVPPRWRGWLTAVAGAVKLIPLGFVGYFLLTRQWAAAARAAIGFAVLSLAAFLILSRDSIAYWTQRLWQTDNVGDPAGERNRALYGTILRWAGHGDAQRLLWLVLALAVTLLAARAVLRHHGAGETLRAVTVVGCWTIAVVPISWTHYLSWAVIAALLLALAPRPWPVAGVLAVLALTLPSPVMKEDAPANQLLALGRELPGIFVAAPQSARGSTRRSAPSARSPASSRNGSRRRC